MPCNYKEYPENWKWLTKQLRESVGDKCELCYAPNGETVARLTGEYLHPWDLLSECDPCGIDFKKTKIILTVHHIDSDKKNNVRQNLIVLCQRCHLRLDLNKHMRKRKESKKNKQQVELLERLKG